LVSHIHGVAHCLNKSTYLAISIHIVYYYYISHVSIEPLIRQYATAFDGTPKTSFPIELFDSLFATTFHITKEEFNPGFEQKLENKWMHTIIDRAQVKSTHEAYMEKGTSLTLVHCNEIGIGLVDCEFMLKNSDEETKVRLVFTIRDHKIVHAKTVDSSTAVLRAQVGETIWRSN